MLARVVKQSVTRVELTETVSGVAVPDHRENRDESENETCANDCDHDTNCGWRSDDTPPAEQAGMGSSRAPCDNEHSSYHMVVEACDSSTDHDDTDHTCDPDSIA